MCFPAEVIEPQKNMPQAIMYTITILTSYYVAGTFALSGMLPYDQISPVGGFPDAFELGLRSTALPFMMMDAFIVQTCMAAWLSVLAYKWLWLL